MHNPIGIYEKALPKDLSWAQRFAAARDAGYDFLEMSVDETPERMARFAGYLAQADAAPVTSEQRRRVELRRRALEQRRP